MKRMSVLAALAVLSACASSEAARRAAAQSWAQSSFCNPCQMPCQSNACGMSPVAAAPKPPPPAPTAAATFAPPGGESEAAQSVALSSATPAAVIHYTTDGSTPTADSPVYSGPIRVDRTTQLQAIAIAPGAPSSPVSSSTYTITPPAPPPPPPPPARVEVTKDRLQLNEVVLFETGKSKIDPRSYSLLDEVAAALKAHPEVKQVRIEGHTDDRGGAMMNRKLSKARAEAIRKYLVQHGVAAGRLTAEGFGQARPVAGNDTPAGREKNRRVDFVITQA